MEERLEDWRKRLEAVRLKVSSLKPSTYPHKIVATTSDFKSMRALSMLLASNYLIQIPVHGISPGKRLQGRATSAHWQSLR